MECPQCQNADQRTIMGLQDSVIYDGVLVWQCLACNHAWPRVFGISHRDYVAREWAASLNEEEQ